MNHLITVGLALAIIFAADRALRVLKWIRDGDAQHARLVDLDGPDERGEDLYGGLGHDPRYDIDASAPGTGPRIRKGWEL